MASITVGASIAAGLLAVAGRMKVAMTSAPHVAEDQGDDGERAALAAGGHGGAVGQVSISFLTTEVSYGKPSSAS
jgi:hypothetical protein